MELSGFKQLYGKVKHTLLGHFLEEILLAQNVWNGLTAGTHIRVYACLISNIT